MGRRRLPEDKKRVRFSLSIRRDLLDELKKNGTVSSIIERLVVDFLRKNEKK